MKREEGIGSPGNSGRKRNELHFRRPTGPTVVAPSGAAPEQGFDPPTMLKLDAAAWRAGSLGRERHELRPPAPSDDPYGGHVIDNRYVVEAMLAKGGMGLVYRCRHRVLGKRVAIKIIRTDIALMPEAPRRFVLEARAASAIGNEHIIDISDYGVLPDGACYLVMELLDGVPLADLIDGHQPLATPRILSIARQVAEGLGAAHKAGIVHRDLKPDNIFLVRRKDEDFIKILDFGIAKINLPDGVRLTQKGAIVGTPHYMSPEQAAGDAVDQRGDIYSLGVILYELASGRVPFDGHCMAVLAKHLQEAPAPFGSLTPPPAVPRELEAVIQKCLAKQPEQRYGSMPELIEALDHVGQAQLRAPSLDAAFRPTLPTPNSSARPSSAVSVPAAPHRSLVAPPKSPSRWVLLGAGIALLSLASLWRMNATERSAFAEAPPEATTPSAAAAAAEPKQAAPAQLPPAPDSSVPEPRDLPAAPAPVAQGATPMPAPTIVEIGPGKSVEIEARTRLSLRLESNQVTLPPPSPASEPKARRTRPKARPKPSPPEPPPARPSSELLNPWPQG